MAAENLKKREQADLLAVGRNCWRIEHASRAGFVVDADAYFKAFVEAARHARRSILITGWDFHSRTRLLCAERRRSASWSSAAFSTTWCGAIASCTSTS